MSLIRPELRNGFRRWRQVMIGVAILAVALWLALISMGPTSPVKWLAVALAVLGAAVIYNGIQRARIRPRTGGRGVVELDEGVLRYLTAGGGMVIALPEVSLIEIETTADGPFEDDLFWIWVTDNGIGRIPGSAHGSDKMIDALAAFPGARYEQVIVASGSVEAARFTVWQRPRPLLH